MEQLSQWIPNSLIIQSKNIALRHWERHNLTISLAIYDDRIEIASPGIFPPQITPENIKEPHDSYPHNLKVAEALYRMTYLENWGSGARRIMDACQAQGVELLHGLRMEVSLLSRSSDLISHPIQQR